MTQRQSILLLLICWALTCYAQSNSTCYYPNGEPSTDVACDPNAKVSACCPKGSICESDGSCGMMVSLTMVWCLERAPRLTGIQTGPHYVAPQLGTCTSQNWEDEGCPNKICGAKTSMNSTAQTIISCPSDDQSAVFNKVCCAPCDCKVDAVTLSPPTAIATAGAVATRNQNATSSITSVSSSSTPVLMHTTSGTVVTAQVSTTSAVGTSTSSGFASSIQSPQGNFLAIALLAILRFF